MKNTWKGLLYKCFQTKHYFILFYQLFESWKTAVLVQANVSALKLLLLFCLFSVISAAIYSVQNEIYIVKSIRK